jgi:hypothetical protein
MKKCWLFFITLTASFLLYCNGNGPPPLAPTTTTTTTTTITTSTTTSEEVKPVVIRETGEGFDTIGEAVDEAEDGNHIDVAAGTYRERPVIRKQLYISGDDRVNTFIDGDAIGDVLDFNADAAGSEVREFTIRNSHTASAGILCDDSSLNLTRLIIKNNGYGILYDNSSGEIFSIKAENNDRQAIYINWGSPSVREVIAKGNLQGIRCENSSPVIIGCSINENTEYGVSCWSGANPDIGGGAGGSPGQNTIRGNTLWDLYNATPNVIMAEQNRWDHTITSDIDTYDIYDNDENAAYGAVDFYPFLTGSSFAFLRLKPRLFYASSLFAGFFRSLFRSDLPASTVYLSSSFEPEIHLTRFELLRARYRSITDERYYPPLRLRASR